MATKTFEELKQLAIQIRDEKTNKQNTATRVGTAMLEHINKLEQDYYDKAQTDEELKERDDKLTELEGIIKLTDKSRNIYITDDYINTTIRFEKGVLKDDGTVDSNQIQYKTTELTESTGHGTFVQTNFNGSYSGNYINLGIYNSDEKLIYAQLLCGETCIFVPKGYKFRVTTGINDNIKTADRYNYISTLYGLSSRLLFLSEVIDTAKNIYLDDNYINAEIEFETGALKKDGTVDSGQVQYRTTVLTESSERGTFVQTKFDGSYTGDYINAIIFDKENKIVYTQVLSGETCIFVPKGYKFRVTTGVNDNVKTADRSKALTLYGLQKNNLLLTKVVDNAKNIYLGDDSVDDAISYEQGVLRQDGTVDNIHTQYRTTELKDAMSKGTYVQAKFDGSYTSEYVNFIIYDSNENIVYKNIYAGETCVFVPEGYKYRLTTYSDYKVRTSNSKNVKSLATLANLFPSINNTKKVLWIGTSIPAGSTYPVNSCKALGRECLNKAIGASHIILRGTETPEEKPAQDLSLSKKVSEYESQYRPLIESGKLDEGTLNIWKNSSYENVILPYLDEIDTIVFDHGYNDRNEIVSQDVLNHPDWDSVDRDNYLGAFNFIMGEIFKRKPFIKIIIVAHFQNRTEDGSTTVETLETLVKVQEMIARHFGYPFIDTYNYCCFDGYFVPNTSNWMSEYNEANSTSYVQKWKDSEGNMKRFQMYCVDTIHPYTVEAKQYMDKLYQHKLVGLI